MSAPDGVLLRRITNRPDGFTLVEVLVALVVLSVVAITLERAAVGSRSAVTRSADWIAAEEVARTLLDTPVPEAREQTLTGTTAGHGWSMTVEPLSLPAVATQSQTWHPMRMTARVAAGSGSVFTAETVRIAKVSSP